MVDIQLCNDRLLDGNQFTGSIPETIGDVETLEVP